MIARLLARWRRHPDEPIDLWPTVLAYDVVDQAPVPYRVAS